VKQGKYLRTEVNELLSGSGNITEETHEDMKAKNRYIDITSGNRVLEQKDVWKFWEWNTTFEGTRYTLLITETGGKAISVTEHKELFPSDKWQFVTCAALPDLTEFWSPTPATGVREAIQAKQISVNQALQNSEEINNPVRYYDYGAIQDPELLQFRANRDIPFKP